MTRIRKWTRDETIVALYLFCTIPFNECSSRHPLIREVAALLNRSAAAVNMKIGNFGRLDSTLAARGVSGLTNGSKLDEEIWNEFNDKFEQLSIESKQILNTISDYKADGTLPQGIEIQRLVNQRVNQDFFRQMVLSAYNNKCCITGISNTQLLEVCHISRWNEDHKNRMNPHNGLPLTVTLHRAYDKMLIGISPDYIVKVSEKIISDSSMSDFTSNFFMQINGSKIMLPDRFSPSKELLDIHYQQFLKHIV